MLATKGHRQSSKRRSRLKGATKKKRVSEASPDSTSSVGPGLPEKIRILVVEDHPFVREGIVALINRQTDLTCCGEADSIVSTPPAVAELKPHLILLDLRLKDGEAFDLMNALRLQFPKVA